MPYKKLWPYLTPADKLANIAAYSEDLADVLNSVIGEGSAEVFATSTTTSPQSLMALTLRRVGNLVFAEYATARSSGTSMTWQTALTTIPSKFRPPTQRETPAFTVFGNTAVQAQLRFNPNGAVDMRSNNTHSFAYGRDMWTVNS